MIMPWMQLFKKKLHIRWKEGAFCFSLYSLISSASQRTAEACPEAPSSPRLLSHTPGVKIRVLYSPFNFSSSPLIVCQSHFRSTSLYLMVVVSWQIGLGRELPALSQKEPRQAIAWCMWDQMAQKADHHGSLFPSLALMRAGRAQQITEFLLSLRTGTCEDGWSELRERGDKGLQSKRGVCTPCVWGNYIIIVIQHFFNLTPTDIRNVGTV